MISSHQGEFWENLLYYLIWLWDGCPNRTDYGKSQYSSLLEGVWGDYRELAVGALKFYQKKFVMEILEWLEGF